MIPPAAGEGENRLEDASGMIRYAITDRHICSGDEASRRNALLTQARRLATVGIDYLQIRERDLAEHDLELLTRDIVEAVSDSRAAGTRVLLNGPAHIATLAGAHGVHLRGGAGERELNAVHQIFELAGLPTPIVSLSCHSVQEAITATAATAGFDLLLFGPVFEKRVRGTLITLGLGLNQLREAAQQIAAQPAAAKPAPTAHPPLRLLALGGITPENTPQCLQAGAHGIAGIRLFL